MNYSPVLAIVTGLFEFSAAIFTFLSAGRKRILYPVGLILLLLAGYQFSEAAVCSQPENLLFARLAFFDITWLPVIGLWLVFQLSSSKSLWWKAIPISYLLVGLVMAVWIIVDSSCVTKSVCYVVISRYSNSSPFDILYGIFYQLGLALTIFSAAAGMVYASDRITRNHLANIQTGILGFVLPSFVVRMLVSEPDGILPSVMCHFALILAISLCILVVRERPFTLKAKSDSSTE
jgi:hypothetical protein